MVLESSKRYISKGTSTTTSTTTTTTTATKINVTSDYGITKIINKNGSGSNYPYDGDEVYVHIIGKTIDGTIFEDTKNGKSIAYSFILGGKGETIKGYNHAIKSMKKGELSTFTIRSKYAYGSVGNGQSVPPNATCIYEIELVSFRNSSDISIEKDGSMLKKILNNSDSTTSSSTTTTKQPRYESNVTIDYNIKIKETGSNVIEKLNYNFIIGQDLNIINLIETILETMQIGEHCLVEIEWNTFLNSLNQIPLDKQQKEYKELKIKQQKVLFDKIEIQVKLISFELGRDKYQYSVLEMTEIGLQKKEQGTELFKQKYFNLARLKYRRAIEFFEFEYGKSQQDKDQIKQYKISCLSNQNVCLLQMPGKQWSQIIEIATETLKLDELHLKSLCIRSKALRETGKANLAYYDIQRALKIDSKYKDALNELEILNKLLKK